MIFSISIKKIAFESHQESETVDEGLSIKTS
jgi:hypothetical protein